MLLDVPGQGSRTAKSHQPQVSRAGLEPLSPPGLPLSLTRSGEAEDEDGGQWETKGELAGVERCLGRRALSLWPALLEHLLWAVTGQGEATIPAFQDTQSTGHVDTRSSGNVRKRRRGRVAWAGGGEAARWDALGWVLRVSAAADKQDRGDGRRETAPGQREALCEGGGAWETRPHSRVRKAWLVERGVEW